jgi:peroxiredoxin
LAVQSSLALVFPQPESEAREYIDQALLPVTRIISENLSTIGVHGTPTVFLIDRNGKIRDIWDGFLSQKAQDELIAHALKAGEVTQASLQN